MIVNKPIDELRKLDVDEIDAMVRETAAIAKRAKDATDVHKSSFPAAGKVICVVRERFIDMREKRMLASTLDFPEFWKNLGGGKLNNHAQSCSVAFSTYVQTGLITEKDYDVCPSTLLETAASISTTVGCDPEHSAVKDAAQQLIERGKDAGQNLKIILATVKPRKPISPEKAQEYIQTLLADGYGPMFIHTLELELPEIKDENKLRAYYSGLIGCIDNCGTEEMQEKWLTPSESGPKLIAA